MHSCELITNLCAKKVLCHRIEVVKNFRCCNHRLCFLQRDWHEQNSSSKTNQLNEAEESAEGHQTFFFLVRGRGLGMRLVPQWYGNCMVLVVKHMCKSSHNMGTGWNMVIVYTQLIISCTALVVIKQWLHDKY